jgi:GNAT superfamily N-acetyltransferase
MNSNYNGYQISDDIQRINLKKVTEWLTGCYWSPGIKRAEVERAANNSSLVVGVFTFEGQQVGYARMVSDKTRFAYFMDVFVDSAHRNKGIAQAIIRFATAHPDYKSIYQWLLATQDAHKVYEKIGFKPLPNPERWMTINKGRPKL